MDQLEMEPVVSVFVIKPNLKPANQYWEYFLTLDSDLETIARYVQFDSKNFKTYSIEFVRLLLATCSEVDVVAKLLCEIIAPNKSAENINQYRSIIMGEYQF